MSLHKRPISSVDVEQLVPVRFVPVEGRASTPVFEMSPRPPDLLRIDIDEIPTTIGLEAKGWFVTSGGCLLQGWSLVPVGLPP